MFANFKATLLKVDLRKAGRKVIVFETSARMSAGELDAISAMIDQEVLIGLDSQVISYRIQKNARTDEPLIQYKVNEGGVVEEVKQEGAQVEMDLGLPAEKHKVKEEAAEISREIVEEFIRSGLSPRYEDLEFDFPSIIQRHVDGESYLRIASELELSTGKLAELLDDYCKRVAPLAAKWDEWRQNKEKAIDQVIAEATGHSEAEPPTTEKEGVESSEDQSKSFQEETDSDESEMASDDVEGFILKNNPTFEDIQYDFPELLKRKKQGETWMEIAQSLKIPSTTLQTAWNRYKKKVKEAMKGQDGAA